MFKRLKGTKDIFGKEAKIIQFIEKNFFEIANNFDFNLIQTPIIEDVNLFIRSVGETSDIVSKEMYVFKDNGNRIIALRPEGTASTIRAYIENKINNLENGKFCYMGPMFRYERPQKGRFRQFIQGGIELIAPKSVDSNFEIINLAYIFLRKLKIDDFILEINNLGSFETRNKYIKHLKEYFLNYYSKLNETSKIRLEKNVLRILDDKEEQTKDFVQNAPKLLDFLSNDEKEDFQNLLKLLKVFNIQYKINPYLVRGLDYYNDVVFEFVSTSKALGSQSTILAGGRYDGMIKEFDGPAQSSIGFAFGVDRLVEIINYNFEKYSNLNEQNDILIGYLNDEEKTEILKITNDLRKEFRVNLLFEKTTIKQLFKQNFKNQPKYLIFKELNAKPWQIKVKTKNEEIEFIYKDINDFKNQIKNLK